MKSTASARPLYRFVIPVIALLTLAMFGCQFPGLFELDAAQSELVRFTSCSDLEGYFRSQALRMAGVLSELDGSLYDPSGFMDPGSGSGGSSSGVDSTVRSMPYSTTNNQEDNVFEADIFQVDSTHAFALHGTHLIIIEAIGAETSDPVEPGPVHQFDDAHIVADLTLEGNPIEMYLLGNEVVVLTRVSHRTVLAQYANSAPPRPTDTNTIKALVIDVSNRADPKITREVVAEGDYLGSRRIGDYLYIVTTGSFGGPANDDTPVGAITDWLDLQYLAILGADLNEWMPHYFNTTFSNGEVANREVARCSCSNTYASPAAPGDDTVGILSFNVTNDESLIDTTTIVGDGTLVYASTESIIIALTNYAEAAFDAGATPTGDWDDEDLWDFDWDDGGGWDGGWGWSSFGVEEEPEEDGQWSYLHRFEVDRDRGGVKYQATGAVEGWILNQFSISEYEGVVRVATQRNRGESDAETMVFTLTTGREGSPSGPLALDVLDSPRPMEVMGALRDIAPGEDLYAARFQGDVGYLVTWEFTDPLWIVDLSNPRSPRLRGELIVPGYSTYLHPIEGGRLLAIGMDVDDFWGDVQGIKLSLFDVGNLDNPRVIDERTEGGPSSESEALTEHRAFRYLDEKQILAVPMDHGSQRGLYLYRINNTGIEPLITIDHTAMGTGTGLVRRAYQIGSYLYSYSNNGVSITNLQSFQTEVEVSF